MAGAQQPPESLKYDDSHRGSGYSHQLDCVHSSLFKHAQLLHSKDPHATAVLGCSLGV